MMEFPLPSDAYPETHTVQWSVPPSCQITAGQYSPPFCGLPLHSASLVS